MRARPVDDGVRLDDDERVAPAWPQLGQADPEETIDRSQVRSFRAAVLKDCELLAEGEDLKLEGRPAPDSRDNHI